MMRKILLLGLFFGCLTTYAQERITLSGNIMNADQEPLPYANVQIEGTSRGTSTDDDGHFEFPDLAPGNYTLKISSVGYQTAKRTITVKAEAPNTLQVVMASRRENLEEVTVEGDKTNPYTNTSSEYVSKMALSELENPQVYTSLSKELLSSQQSYSVEQAMNNVAGVHRLWDAANRAAIGGAYYSMRGFSTQSMARNGLAGNITSTIDVANIERIEVIKGPTGTLFGSTLPSFGGLINRVTKKPGEETFGSVTISGGQYQFFRVAADYNTALNADKTLLMRVNAAYNTTGSFQDNGYHKTLAFAPSLLYKANDRLTISVDAEIYHAQASDFQAVYLDYYYTPNTLGMHSPSDTKVDYYLSYKANDLYSTSDVANVFGEALYEISDEWTSRTNISLTHSSSDGAAPFFYITRNDAVTGDATDTGNDYMLRDVWTPTGSDQVFEFQQNFMGHFKLGAMDNQLTLGLDYYSYDVNVSYLYASGSYDAITDRAYLFDVVTLDGAASNYYDFNRSNVEAAYANSDNKYTYLSKKKTNTYSAYGIDVLHLTHQLSVMASLRIDRFENEDIYSPVTNTVTSGYGQTALSPKFGAVYQLVEDHVSLFGNYQNGFQNVGPTTQPDGSIDKFDPTQANQWEGGVKLDILHNALSATVSYYNIDVKNNTRSESRTYVDTNGDTQSGSFTVQNGTQLSRGFEAEVVANPISGLNFIAGYAFNHSEWKKSTDDVEGLRPANSGPEQTANLWASYRLGKGSLEGFGVGVGGNYSSSMLVANTRSGGKFTLPAYTIGNANIFYEQKAYRISLAVKNFTDKEYYIGYSSFSPQMTRRFVADVMFRF